jgi:hypothetical protein
MSNANLLSRQSNQLFDSGIPISISTLSVGTLQSGSIAPVELQSDVDFVPPGQFGIGGLGAVETSALYSLTQQVATLKGADISFLGDVQVLGGLEVSGSVIHSGDLDVLGDLSCGGIAEFYSPAYCLSGLEVSGGDLLIDGTIDVIFGSNGGVHLGLRAGQNPAGNNGVAIGTNAGASTQGGGGVAVGLQAGQTSQGTYAVAVGTQAGQTSQHANSIVLNATGSPLNTLGISRSYVAPVRGVAHGVGVGVMVYDPVAFEMTYSTT